MIDSRPLPPREHRLFCSCWDSNSRSQLEIVLTRLLGSTREMHLRFLTPCYGELGNTGKLHFLLFHLVRSNVNELHLAEKSIQWKWNDAQYERCGFGAFCFAATLSSWTWAGWYNDGMDIVMNYVTICLSVVKYHICYIVIFFFVHKFNNNLTGSNWFDVDILYLISKIVASLKQILFNGKYFYAVLFICLILLVSKPIYHDTSCFRKMQSRLMIWCTRHLLYKNNSCLIYGYVLQICDSGA